MSKLRSKIMMSIFAFLVIGIGSVNARLTCTTQPSCEALGYNRADVDNCVSYIHCPFDASYKKCITLDHTEGKCTGFTLADCPPRAKCEPCGSHRISTCHDGYKISGDTCICATVCTDRLTQKDIPLNAGPIKQSCDACGTISDVITGWSCNDGYVQIGQECKKHYRNCEDAEFIPEKPSNAACANHIIYLPTGDAVKCYSGCACNDGYVNVGTDRDDGMECEKFIDCSAYPLDQCPDNADCGTCTDNWNKTTYKFNKCNSGYKEQSGACVCEKVCSDTFTGAIPANATATKEICEACGVYTEIVTGFTCNDGYVKVDNICKPVHNTCAAANPAYLSAPKANATCSTTTIYQSNGSTLTCYYNCKCNTEYTEQAGQCICAKTCKDKITSKPDNSSFVTENCVACGISSTIKTDWTCNSGYHKSGNICECDKTCNHQITTKPANSSFTTTTCSACGKNYTINTGWTCNSGYTKIGNSCEKIIDCSSHTLSACPSNAVCSSCTSNYGVNIGKTTYKFETCANNYTLKNGICVCATTCSDRAGELPANATYTTAVCTACGVSTTIKTGWRCNAGYTQNGNSCVCATSCSDKLSTKPANSSFTTETCTACGVSTTIKTGWTCNSGYVNVGGVCQPYYSSCEAAGYLSNTKPNANCSRTSIYLSNGSQKTCYYNCSCKSGYVNVSGVCQPYYSSCEAAGYLSSTPPNASCSRTSIYLSNGTQKTCYYSCSCNSGYQSNSSGQCVCTTICADTYTGTLPSNAYYTTSTCTACGVNTTIKTGWACNSGYVKVGNTCKKYYNSCSEAGYLPNQKPNATCYTTYIYNQYGNVLPCYFNCSCNSGYYQSAFGQCVCATSCYDKVNSKPANASYTTETCTACGVSSTIKTGWTCDTGYVKYNNDCVCPAGTHPTKSQCESAYAYSNCTLDVKCYKPTSCKPGYAVTANLCGSTAAGYSLGLSDNAGCRQCIKNSCPTISVTYTPYGSHTSSISVQTSTDSNAENCGSSGSKGYTSEITSYFSGEARCYACKPKTCPSGYIAGSTQCDATQEAVTHPGVMSGDEPCTTCIKKIICRIGTYETRSECQRYNIGARCIQLANGCWEPIEMCHYTLDSCPTGGICNSCTTKSGQTKYNLTGCRTNYYMENNYCVSCAAVASTYRDYNALAKMTYLNCCGRNYCRKSPCTTSKNGSWTDGCLPLHISMGSFESDVYEYRRACQENMQDLYDRIADFNSKCPNHAVSNLFSPYNQCSSVSINGRLARPSDNNIHGC